MTLRAARTAGVRRKAGMTVRGRPLAAAASLVLLLAGTGAVLLLRSPDGPGAPWAATDAGEAAGPPAAPVPFAFRWPAGTVYTYELALEVTGTLGLPGSGQPDGPAPLAAHLALEAELVLRSYGKLDREGEPYVLGVRLARLHELDWSLGGQPLLPDRGQALAGPELVLLAGADGAFHSLEVAAGEPDSLVNLFRQVLAPLEVVVSPGLRTWTHRQTNTVGDVQVAYAVQAEEPGRLTLHRRPVRCTRLAASSVLDSTDAHTAGTSVVVLERAGHLGRIRGAERISARRAGAGGELALRQEVRIEARLLSISRAAAGGPDAAARLAGLASTGLGEVSSSGDVRRQLLEQRAGDLTLDRLVQDLLVHGPAPKFPDPGRWMWRATGFLLLHPEGCRELVDVFRAPEMTERGRGRLLDLLAATGSPEAQRVLAELLETPEAKEAEHHELLVQRLGLVEHPTAETVDYLRAKVERGDGASTLAAAHALGAAIGKRAREAGGAVDERAAGLLRAGLAGAGTAQEQADWLRALGNAGLVEDVPLLAGYAADQDPSVRAAAATALRKTQAPAAEAALLGLAADPDPYVQGRALHTLTAYTLNPAHFEELRHVVVQGRLGPGNTAMLLTLLERNRHQPGDVLPVLAALLARPFASQRLLLRARALQKDLTPGG